MDLTRLEDEICDDLFVPVTDAKQDKDEDDCAAPGSPELEDYEQRHTCKLDVDYVRPAQPAVGMTAVNCKRDNLITKTEKKLDKYLRKGKRVVPAVIGPDGNYYITDHHHLATAVYKTLEEEPEKYQEIRLYAEIVGNLYTDPSQPPSEQEMEEFWAVMSSCNNAYLYYLGVPVNPLDPQQMPTSLSRMKDDPYRTLSRWVREADGYIKPEVQPANFLEFVWGDELRDELGEDVTLCAIGDGTESAPCQEQIGQLRGLLEPAMASARAYNSVEWIEDGGCASNLEGDPEALVACGYNPEFLDVEVEKYITADRGCDTAWLYEWQPVDGGVIAADTVGWYLYAHGHSTYEYLVCRVSADGTFYAGVYVPDLEPETGSCSYVDDDDIEAESADFDALTGVQAMYDWSEYTEEIADDDDDFFDEAVPVGTRDSDLGETFVCASGERIGWVKRGKKTCHLSDEGRRVPFWVLVED